MMGINPHSVPQRANLLALENTMKTFPIPRQFCDRPQNQHQFQNLFSLESMGILGDSTRKALSLIEDFTEN